MASHHQHHHCCPNPPPTSTCCCSSSHCYAQQRQLAPPQAPADPLLQTIVTLLQQNQWQQSLPTCPKNPRNLQNPQLQKQHFQQQKTYLKQQELHSQTQSIISSLLDRINVLESSLHQFCTSGFHHASSSSVRYAAARVIQAHFRSFLVRRSRTLRQLKELAFIKSSVNSLKSSVCNQSHFNVGVVYQQAVDLLLKLDSIQGGDPMIKDGKRSVSSELVRFLEFVDGFAVKGHAVSFKSRKGVKLVHKVTKSSNSREPNRGSIQSDKKEIIDNLRERIEKISNFTGVCQNDEEEVEFEGFQQVLDEDDPDHDHDYETSKPTIDGKSGIPTTPNGILILRNGNQPRVRKSVSFPENGSLSRFFGNACEPVSGGEGISADGSVSTDEDEAVENEFEDSKGFFRDAKDKEAARKDNGGSPQSSGGVNFTFSAPAPVRMESRVDLLNKKAAGKEGH